MKKSIRFHAAFLFSAVVILLGTAYPAFAEKKVDKSCKAPAAGKVIIENISGSIDVTGWDREEVAVSGTMDDRVERLDFDCDSNRTNIKVIVPENRKNGAGADLKINVPAGSSVDINTVTAGIRVGSLRGALNLESVTGDIYVTGEPNAVEAKSVTGKVDILASAPTVEAKSVSSKISLKGVRSKVKASSTSGDIEVSDVSVSDGNFKTVSGDILFDGALLSGARLKIESLSGKIEAILPESVSGEFDVSTFSGNIVNDFGPSPQKTSRYGPGQKLAFSTGSNARISMESFSGPLFLKRR
jgi:hypothetical protein